MSVQKTYQTHANPSEPPEAEIIEDIDLSDGRRGLALRVSIEGRDHTVALSTDALQAAGMTGPAAVELLRRIAVAAEGIHQHIGLYRKKEAEKQETE